MEEIVVVSFINAISDGDLSQVQIRPILLATIGYFTYQSGMTDIERFQSFIDDSVSQIGRSVEIELAEVVRNWERFRKNWLQNTD